MANIFVDPSAAHHGDGSTYTPAASDGAAGAYNTILGIAAPSSGDFVWIAFDGVIALSAAFTANWAGVNIIGWPVLGDYWYAFRPYSARASWDAKTPNLLNGREYAKFSTSSAAHNFAPVGNGITCHGLWIDSSLTTSGTTPLGVFAGNASVHERLAFTYSSAADGTSADLMCYANTGESPKITHLYCQGASTGGADTSICKIHTGASNTAGGFAYDVQVDCAFLQRGAASDASGALVVGNTPGHKPLALQLVNVYAQQTGSITAHQGSALVIVEGSARINDVTIHGKADSSHEGPGIFVAGSDCQLLNLRGENNVGCVFNAGSVNTIDAKHWFVNYDMAGTGVGVADYRTGGVTPPLVIAASDACVGNTISLFDGVLSVASAAPKVGDLGSGNVCLFDYTDYLQRAVYRVGVAPQCGYEIFSANQGRAIGPWGYENAHGTLSANNAYRVGGGNYSILCAVDEMDYWHNVRALLLSVKGRECLTVELKTGTNVITLYGAYAVYSADALPNPPNYNGGNNHNPDANDIGFTFDYFDSSNNPQTANSLTTDGTLLTDDPDSSWVGDTGLTAFKVTLTLDGCAAQVVPNNLIVSPEGDSVGYFYIDPIVVVA